MRKLILYSAMSLDGFIAKADGSVDWLEEPETIDYGYLDFIASVDTVLMGGSTFRQVEGFEGPFPYADKNCYVYSHDVSLKHEYAKFIHHDIIDHVKNLKTSTGKDIWLVGGGEINSQMLESGVIDEMHLFIFPIILGEGIRLFERSIPEVWFYTRDIVEYSTGVIKVVYSKINAK